MIKNILFGTGIGVAFAAVLSACSGGSGGSFIGPTSANAQYKQVELLSRPAVK